MNYLLAESAETVERVCCSLGNTGGKIGGKSLCGSCAVQRWDFCLDLCFGDPRWLPHPVVLIEKAFLATWNGFCAGSFPRLREGTPCRGDSGGSHSAGSLLFVSLGILLFGVPHFVLALVFGLCCTHSGRIRFLRHAVWNGKATATGVPPSCGWRSARCKSTAFLPGGT